MSQQDLKVIHLNIEKDKHIPLVLEFLKREKPDVICLQEIFIEDFENFKKELRMNGAFCEQRLFKKENGVVCQEGVVVLTRFSIINYQEIPYTRKTGKNTEILSTDMLPKDQKTKGAVVNNNTKKLLIVTIENNGKKWKFATTQFTWGFYGYLNKESKKFTWNIEEKDVENQMEDLERLFTIFDTLGEFIFTADINAPRGKKVFDTLAKKLKDNVPTHYKESIDGNIHCVGPLPLMVDGLFTTDGYIANNVMLKDGLSDHMAIMANLLPRSDDSLSDVIRHNVVAEEFHSK